MKDAIMEWYGRKADDLLVERKKENIRQNN